jgi:hypothetical protein
MGINSWPNSFSFMRHHCVWDFAYYRTTSVSCMLLSLCLIMLLNYVPLSCFLSYSIKYYWTAQNVSVVILPEFSFASKLSYDFFNICSGGGLQKLERIVLKIRKYLCVLLESLLTRSTQNHFRWRHIVLHNRTDNSSWTSIVKLWDHSKDKSVNFGLILANQAIREPK